MAHIGTPKKTRKAAEALLAREAAWLERNLMRGEVVSLPDGTFTVQVTDTAAVAR